MEARRDAHLRLAAGRHPASRAIGTLPLAQHQLEQAVQAFVVVMRAAGKPGSRALPAPVGRNRWPRGHGARHVAAWPVPVPVDPPFQCWIDADGHWWMLRFGVSGSPIDAHVVGTPLRTGGDLGGFTDALDQILVACGVPR